MNKITLNCEGHKVATPVTSKEEYLKIRNSLTNRENLMKAHQGDEDAKRRLVQFNYNDLLPDGKLAGCCHPSSYFAGDVDCEGLAASKEIAQRFLEHKDEIGLMELSRSARYGLHYVCRRQMGRTILENQVRVALITKTEMDTSAHDLQRVMFTVTADSDELLYLDEAIFQDPLTLEESEREYELLKQREQKGLEEVPAGAKKPNKHYRPWEEDVTKEPSPCDTSPCDTEVKQVDADPSCLRAFDLCMDEAGLTERALQIEGVRHNSLRSILSVGACQLMPKEQMVTVVRTRMPGYADEKDCQQLISDFYANYTEMNRPLTKRQREIHAEAFGEALDPEDADEELIIVDATTKQRQLNVRALPPGLREPVMMAPKNMQMNVLCSILPVAAAYADQVLVQYADNKMQHLGLMCLIIGRQAGGKSSVKEAVELWMRPMSEASKEARAQEDLVKKSNKLRKASERAKEMPEVVIIKVPITISCSTLLKRLKNAQGHTLFSFGEELDTLLKTNAAGSWSAKYDVYRYSFDRGEWGQDYNSDQAESGEVNVAYNWVILGTYGAFNRCFNRENVENGLGGRILISELPDLRFSAIPKYRPMTQAQEEAVMQAIELLKSKSGFVDTPLLRKHIDRWLEEKRLQALKNADEAMDELRKRAAVIAFRCAVVYHLLSGKERESRSCIEFMLMMADYVLQNQMHMLCEKMENQQAKNEPNIVKAIGNKSVWDKLPHEFTLNDVKIAKGLGLEESSYRSIVCKWKASGLIEELPESQRLKDKKRRFRKLCA